MARVESAGAAIAACLKRASGGSCARATSSRQASSSISRNVRLGFGTWIRSRRLRAGLASRCPSSIASPRTAASMVISFFSEAAPNGTTRRFRASRRSAPACSASRSSRDSRSLCALNSRHRSPSNFIEAVATEEPLEMPCPPAVVAASVRMERLFSEDAVKPGCQPVLDVVVEERDLGWSDAPLSLAASGLLPETPASTLVIILRSSIRAVRSFRPPPHPCWQLQSRRSCRNSLSSVPVGRSAIRHRLLDCGYGTCASGPTSCCPGPEDVDAPLGNRVRGSILSCLCGRQPCVVRAT